jgi:hypothetical protein
VISLRKEVRKINGQFIEHGHGPDGHAHFFSTLETVREILRLAVDKISSTKTEQTSKADVDKLINVFDVLNLEEPTSMEPAGSAAPSVPQARNAPSKRKYDIKTTHDGILVFFAFLLLRLKRDPNFDSNALGGLQAEKY